MTNYFLLAALLITGFLSADCNGRIDIGPAYLNIDMLESGKTVRTLNLAAVKGEGTIMLFRGGCLCVKPSLLLATGKADLNSGSLGLGLYMPLPFKITLTPSIGYTETHFRSKLDLPQYNLFKQKERFTSRGLYVGLDASWTVIESWRIYAQAQWCQSRVHWKIGNFPRTKSNCAGPNYAIALEHDLNEEFSISLAAGYNSSLSKEKHGLRGKGIKLGLAYWW